MAEYKVVNAEQLDAELTNLANKIREKGGTTEELDFYKGDFTNAVDAIESGGDFFGVKFSDFTGINGLPKVADVRDFQPFSEILNTSNMFQTPNGAKGLFYAVEDIYLYDGINIINTSMFEYKINLQRIHADLTNVTVIGNYAFYRCYKLLEVPYMPMLDKISEQAFRDCTTLTKFTFYKTPSQTISTSAFQGCTNIKDIYVPWAEGAVENAPWGATNATIHYNTTYDENHNPIDCSCDPETEGCPNAES